MCIRDRVCTDITKSLIDKKNPQKTSIFSENIDEIYKLNKEEIGEDLALPDVYIFIPGFKKKNSDRSRYLLGVLVENDVSVENGRGRNTLNILKDLVDHKSEIPLKNTQSYENKKIKSSEINELFINTKKNEEMKEYYHQLVDALEYPVEQKITMKILYNEFSFIENDDEYIKLKKILKENNMLNNSYKFSNDYIDECRNILEGKLNIIDSDKITSKIIYCYLREVLNYDN